MEYWYLWAIFVVLCIVTAFVLKKASKALRLHNDDQKRMFDEIERLKTLKTQFQNADGETVRAADPGLLLAGAYAVLQAELERAENPNARFAAMCSARQYVYALSCFLEDTEENLTFFFKNNCEPILHLAVDALDAVGAENISEIVRREYAMFDENNETVSLDTERFSEFDAEFTESFDKPRLLKQVKQYIAAHRTEIFKD